MSQSAGSAQTVSDAPETGFIDFAEILSQPAQATDFILKPFLTKGGVTLIHGKKSVGKSPLSWELAHAVASGRPFMGKWPVAKPGRVLYIELDTPASTVYKRMRLIAHPVLPPKMFWVMVTTPFDVLQQAKDEHSKKVVLALHHAHKTLQPVAVVVNTLVKCHSGDMNDSGVPSRVYGAFQRIFPGTAVAIMGHDRKASRDVVTGRSAEDALGSIHWLNDAQCVLHLTSKNKQKGLLTLWHDYNQAAQAHGEPYELQLGSDGTQIGLEEEAAVKRATILAAWAATADPDNPDLAYSKRYALVQDKLGKDYAGSTATIRRLVLDDESDEEDAPADAKAA